MQVRYLVSEASAAWSRVPGEVYDLPDAEAVAAIEAGKALAVTPAPESATRSAPETTAAPAARGRRA